MRVRSFRNVVLSSLRMNTASLAVRRVTIQLCCNIVEIQTFETITCIGSIKMIANPDLTSDTAFETLVDVRLRAGGLNLAENTSWTMMHSSEFQTWKCSFGDTSNDDVPRFPVRVPLLDGSISNRAAGIEGGSMMFSQ